MKSPEEQAATQLANIERDSGLTPQRVAAMATDAGFDKHGQIVALLKTNHGITHGNANLLAPGDDRVREGAGMCSHRIDLHEIEEIDDAVARWLGDAYDAAG